MKWYLDNQEWMDQVTSGEYQKYYEIMYQDGYGLFFENRPVLPDREGRLHRSARSSPLREEEESAPARRS